MRQRRPTERVRVLHVVRLPVFGGSHNRSLGVSLGAGASTWYFLEDGTLKDMTAPSLSRGGTRTSGSSSRAPCEG